MIYATRADLQELGLTARALTGIANTEQDAALSAASNKIDSYLSKRFELPLTVAGDDLKHACVSMTAYMLLSRRGFSAGVGDAEQLRLNHEDALRWLKDVANGIATPQYCTDGKGDSTNVSAPPRFVYQYRQDDTTGEFTATSSKTRGW